MKTNRSLMPSLVAALTLLGAGNGFAADGVAASFDRMLAHQPVAGTPVLAKPNGDDPLLKAMVIPLRDGVLRPAPAADAVAESFARLFAHTPSPHSPAVPAANVADPLLAAMVEPLRQWLAESAAPSRYASAAAAGQAR